MKKEKENEKVKLFWTMLPYLVGGYHHMLVTIGLIITELRSGLN